MAQDKEMRVTRDALIWKENPAFPKGVQIATVVGDPKRQGDVVVMRIKFPPNFQMPPHIHPYSEVVTLISGPIGTSHGEKFEKNGEMLKPGSLWVYPAKHAHYAWTGNEEAILQVQFTGPGGIDYINPADDCRLRCGLRFPKHREDVYFRAADFFGGEVFFRGAAFTVGGLSASLTALPAWNRTALLAAISMVSPVCGFRP
jgi:quercetin dioxygenase-like cupin family protein